MMASDPINPTPEDSQAASQDAAPPAELPQPAEPVLSKYINCWRCGLTIPENTICPHCEAAPTGATLTSPVTFAPPRVLGVILAYVVFLSTSLIWAAVLHATEDRSDDFVDHGIVLLESIDALFTLLLFVFLGRFRVRKPKVRVRVLAWLIAPLVSVGMYFLAHAYVEMLREYINAHWLNVEHYWTFTPFYIAAVAIQPAVVEELFFRYFAFGALRQVTNVHSAVVLSAMMFALAHLYNPLGLPILFLMGLVLGYARSASGGLLLPMLMHFSHNCAILWMTAAN